jgi:uncharacterized protein YlzI (FlbEa/FlbD family)
MVYQQKKTIGDVNTLIESVMVREETGWSPYKVRKLTEEQKSVVAENIVTRLFNDIKSKAMSVDFAPIDASRGDITKLKNHDALANGIKYLVKVSNKNEDIKAVALELQMAYNTLVKHKKEFEMGFKMNNSLIRFVYNSVVVGLIQGTSFVVAESVEFVKDNINLYKAEVKKSRNVEKNNHIKGIVQFNEMERKGQVMKFFKEVQTFKESASIIQENGVAVGLRITSDVVKRIAGMGTIGKIVTIIGLIGFVLSFTRSFIFMYYNTRVKLSQYLKHLQEFVLMNSSTLGNDAKKTKERQEKIAESLGKLSDLISVDQNVSNDRTNSQVEESNKVTALDNKDADKEEDTDLDLY